MVNKTPIYCPNCNRFVTYEESLMYYVMPPEGFKCPYCGKIVIERNKPIFVAWIEQEHTEEKSILQR